MRSAPGLLTLQIVLFSLLSGILSSCGYSIHGYQSLPFSEIKIGVIENRTLQPKLEDKLNRALVEEFTRQGISVNTASARKLSARINTYDMAVLSEKNDVALDYQIIVNADFRITDSDGKTQELKGIGSPFIISFSGSADFATLLANKETAEEKAMRDIAMQVVGALIYK